MTDLHIILSLSAAGTLKRAIEKKLLTGDVFTINDMPGVGPLDDGKKRTEFLRGLPFRETPIYWLPRDADVFEQWRQLQARLREKPVDRLIIWAGSDGNDYVFIRMACHWLERMPVNVMLVQAPPLLGYHSIAIRAVEELAPLISLAVSLNTAERNALAREYEDIVSHPGLLRECDADGVLQFKELDAHDSLILSFCSKRWQTAVRVIGQTMGFSDPRNSLGDAFISSRLEHLIVSGQVVADGPRTSMGAFRVKLASARS